MLTRSILTRSSQGHSPMTLTLASVLFLVVVSLWPNLITRADISQEIDHKAPLLDEADSSSSQMVELLHDSIDGKVSSCREEANATGEQSRCRAQAKEDYLAEKDNQHVKEIRSYFDEEYAASDLIRWNYIKEVGDKYTPLAQDELMDQRLANIISTVRVVELISLDPHKIDSGDKQLDEERLLSLAGPQVNDEQCGKSLRKMLELIDEMGQLLEERRQNSSSTRKLDVRHTSLAFVLDSFGRYESGQLLGKTLLVGSYEQCKSGQLILDAEHPDQKTSCRLCWAKLKLHKHLDPRLVSTSPDNVISVGICLPESCHTISFRKHKDLLQKLVNTQFKLPKTFYLDENLELESVFCTPDEGSGFSKVSFGAKLLITLLVAWLGLLVYATKRDNELETLSQEPGGSRSSRASNSSAAQIYAALSLKKSWNDFTGANHVPVEENRVSLDSLTAIKVTCCAFVVAAHAMIAAIAVCANLLKAYNVIDRDPIVFGLIGGTVITDTFYVITGIVLTYVALKKFDASEAHSTTGPKSLGETFFTRWFMLAVSRHLRLLPLYFLVFWFKKSILINMAPYPLWDFGFNKETEAGSCRLESWITPFTYAASTLPLNKQCMPHAWSVANDLLFSAVLTPVIVILAKKPKLGIALAVIISIASNWSMYNTVVNYPQPMLSQLSDLRPWAFAASFKHFSHAYAMAHYRAYSFLVGVLAGFALYHYDATGKIKAWPQWFKGPATATSLAICFFILISAPIIVSIKDFLLKNPYHRGSFDVSFTVGRLLWCIANAVVFLRMMTDWRNTFVVQNSRGSFWSAMLKLNYALLLIHIDVQMVFVYMQTSLNFLFNKFSILIGIMSAYMMCLAIAVPVYVMLENPINKLIRIYTSQRVRHKTTANGIKSGSEARALETIHKKTNEDINGTRL